MIKYILTGIIVFGLALTIISKIGVVFGFKQRSYAGLAKTGLIFSALIMVVAMFWYFFGQKDRDISIIIGPAVIFLVCLDIFVRQKKNNHPNI
jgi:uncharacterized membrane protein YedE/YeeE